MGCLVEGHCCVSRTSCQQGCGCILSFVHLWSAVIVFLWFRNLCRLHRLELLCYQGYGISPLQGCSFWCWWTHISPLLMMWLRHSGQICSQRRRLCWWNCGYTGHSPKVPSPWQQGKQITTTQHRWNWRKLLTAKVIFSIAVATTWCLFNSLLRIKTVAFKKIGISDKKNKINYVKWEPRKFLISRVTRRWPQNVITDDMIR